MLKLRYLMFPFLYALILGVCLFLFFGCGVTPQKDIEYIEAARERQTIKGYQDYLEQAPRGEYTDEALAAIAALGQAFPEAPAYSKESEKPFPTFIIEKYQDEDDHCLFRTHEWNSNLSQDLLAKSISNAVLFVVLENSSIYHRSKNYINDNKKETTIKGYIIQTKIEVREAKTGGILFEGMLDGAAPVFKSSYTSTISGSPQSISGSPISYSEFESWLLLRLTQSEKLVTDPALEQAICLTLEHMGYTVQGNLTVDDIEMLRYLEIVPQAAREFYADENSTDGTYVIVDTPVSQIEGLQYAKNIVVLDLSFSQITDISALAGLKNLDVLIIDNETYINNPQTVKTLESQGCQIVRTHPPESFYNKLTHSD